MIKFNSTVKSLTGY